MGLKYLLENERKSYLTESRAKEMELALRGCIRFSVLTGIPILDIGASEGKTYEIFKEIARSMQIPWYIATELNKELARNLKEKYPELEVVVCTAYNLPLRNNCVNALSLNVINWKPMNQRRHIDELIRVSSDVCYLSLYTNINEESKRRFRGEIREIGSRARERIGELFINESIEKLGEFEDEVGELSLFKIDVYKEKSIKI